jgi:hypothetical protein
MVVIVSLRHSHFSCFGLGYKKQCQDDKSHASSVPVAHRQPLVASVMEVPGASGAPQGAVGAEVVDAGPQLGDSTRSLLQDLVVHGAGAGTPRSTVQGDAASALGSLSTMSSEVSRPYLPGSPGAPSPPIN